MTTTNNNYMDWTIFLTLMRNAAYLHFSDICEKDMALAEGIFDMYGEIYGGTHSNGYGYSTAAIPPTSDFFDNIFQYFDIYESEDIDYILNEHCPEDSCGKEGIELWRKYREILGPDNDDEVDWDEVVTYISEELRNVLENSYVFSYNNKKWILLSW